MNSRIDEHFTKKYHANLVDVEREQKSELPQPGDYFNLENIYVNARFDNNGQYFNNDLYDLKTYSWPDNDAFNADLKQAINQVFHNHKMWPLE